MNLKPALLFVLVVVAGCSVHEPTAEKAPALKGLFPSTFQSVDSAIDYKRHLGAGGRVDIVRFVLSSYLVVFQHGSGVPVIGIGIYKWRLWTQQWELVAEARPPAGGEFFRAKPSHGNIVLVGDRSGQRWPLFEPK